MAIESTTTRSEVPACGVLGAWAPAPASGVPGAAANRGAHAADRGVDRNRCARIVHPGPLVETSAAAPVTTWTTRVRDPRSPAPALVKSWHDVTERKLSMASRCEPGSGRCRESLVVKVSRVRLTCRL